jgi:LacI family transcriptional regulator
MSSTHPTRASLIDVARAAGVSLATVDRVLHGRAGVHARTAAHVHAVVKSLAYRPDPAAARLARTRHHSVCFVLPSGDNPFVERLAEQVRAMAGWLGEQRAAATVQRVDVFAPAAVADHLAGLARRFDAVITVALDHPQVRAAIDDLVAQGTEVITLVSDVPTSRRSHFVGIDNVAAGRTAATLVGRFLGNVTTSAAGHPPGPWAPKVGVVLGSHALRDHAERLFGFQQILSAEYPGLQMLQAIEGQDASGRTRQAIETLLHAQPDVKAIYSIGAGNPGIEAALRASGRACDIVWICHELTPLTRRALLDGVADAVISQDAGHEVRSACRVALARLSNEAVLTDQERIRIDIFVKDNLP